MAKALRAKFDKLAAEILKSDPLHIQFGTGEIPVHVAASLPQLPEGYEFVLVSRRADPWFFRSFVNDANYETPPLPYEWRVFAAKRGGVIPRGKDQVVIDAPIILEVQDGWTIGRIGLPPDSFEFAHGTLVPCDTIVLPVRNNGEDIPLPPAGYGVVVNVQHDHDCEYYISVLAVPLGTYAMTNRDGNARETFDLTSDGEAIETHVDNSPGWQQPDDHYVFNRETFSWERPSR